MKNLRLPSGYVAVVGKEQSDINGGYTVHTSFVIGTPRRNAPPPRPGAPERGWFAFPFVELFAGMAAMFTVFSPSFWFGLGRSSSADFGGSAGGVSSIKDEYDAIKLF